MSGHLTIRTDGDAKIGVGHLVRCIALAQAWRRQDGRVTLVTRGVPDRLPRCDGLELMQLGDASREEDIDTTLAAGDGWVVVDGYHFDNTYLRAVKDAGRRLLVIDDTIRLDYYPVDALLNPSPGFSETDYARPMDAKMLLGPTYAMLREEILQARSHREKPSGRTRILVTMGGSDPRGLTRIVLKGIATLDRLAFEMQVVLGPAHASRGAIESLAERRENIEVLLSPQNFPRIAARADIAVTAAGSTCWELAYLGTPALTVVAADHQEPIASALERAEAGQSLGDGSLLDPRDLSERILRLAADSDRRARMSAAGQRLVDGLGADRVASAFLERSP